MKLRISIMVTLFASLALLAACGKGEDDSASVEKTAEQAKEAVSEAASDARQAAGEAMDKAGEMAGEAKDAAGEAASRAAEAGSEAMDKAAEVADDAMTAAGTALAAGDAARGKALSLDCADCHGENGMGDESTPKLAGLDEAYFVKQMQAYKAGTRKDEDDTMLMYAENLSERDMTDLAAYYASLPAE